MRCGKKQFAQSLPVALYVGDAWYTLLQDSRFWDLTPKDGYYVYVDQCTWVERSRLLVPCDGAVYTSGSDVTRITQRLHTRKWGVVTLVLKYGWVELSERRLVPQTLMLGWRDKTITATWSGYQEYRATEPKVSEAEADDGDDMGRGLRPAAVIEEATPRGRSLGSPETSPESTQGNEYRPATDPASVHYGGLPVDNKSSRPTANPPSLLTLPDGVWKEVKIESKLKRILKRIWRKQ